MNPDLVAIAPRELSEILSEEVGDRVIGQFDRLYLLRGKAKPNWAQNIWLKPETLKFKSISEAAKKLKSVQRSWWLHTTNFHRRAQLIQDQLPPIKQKPIEFLDKMPTAPLGSWTLLDEDTMIFSAECTSVLPDGEVAFKENRIDPPSRAYLKLWELFTLTGSYPKEKDKVIDLGSAPGGWTWVLDQLGCEVTSVDKAALEPKTKFSKRVKYVSESAFGLKPPGIGEVSWMFSDVICYPERLLELVKKWEPTVPNIVCTIKFQGSTNFEIVKEFLRIEGSQVRHQTCNKHELTWWRLL